MASLRVAWSPASTDVGWDPCYHWLADDYICTFYPILFWFPGYSSLGENYDRFWIRLVAVLCVCK